MAFEIEDKINYKYCRFCECRKENDQFIKVFSKGRFVTWKCKECKRRGKLPVAEREAIEARRAANREASNAAKMLEASRQRQEEITKRLRKKANNEEKNSDA